MPPDTARLAWRRFTPADIDLLVELDSDPEVMRFLNGGLPSTRAFYADDVFPRWAAMEAKLPGQGFFAAFHRTAPGRPFVGWFHLRPAHHWPGELELGYRLRREFWGDGLATEGSRALIAYAFTRLDAPLVVAATLLANTGSRRVMEKAGMSFVGEFVEDRWSGPDKRAVKYAVYKDRTLPADGADGTSGGLPGLEGPEPEVRA
jgi:RimJ/RimL family protein N-acetyltransferase